MKLKEEGALFPPVPVPPRRPSDQQQQGSKAVRGRAEPPCEMCGASVIVTHCKSICVHCGFMTGCSEGV